MKRQSKFRQAMTAYNRTAGQLKRYYDVDPAKYIEGKTTTAGVERALKELRREAERQQVERAVEKYEKYTRVERSFKQEQKSIRKEQTPKFYFDPEKQTDYEQRVAAYEQGKSTFIQRYGAFGMNDANYDKFVSFIGALPEEYKSNEAFGSKNVAEAWRTAQDLKLSDEQMLRVMIDTMDNANGQGLNQETLLHNLYENMREAAR